MSVPCSERLLEVLAEARTSGFLGPGRVEDHARHALRFAEAAGSAPARMLDLGSGGGVPGLVLAEHWPDAEVVLLDGSARRTAFLDGAMRKLGLQGRVRVERALAEVAGRNPDLRGSCDLVTARSFAAPAVTAECGAPLLRPGGALVVSEPPEPDPARWPAEGVALFGFAPPVRAAGCVRLELIGAVSDDFPRRAGLPAKRPLF